MLHVRDAGHLDFNGYGDLLLNLFGGAAGPLCDHLDVVVSHIRIGFHGQIVKRDSAPNEKQHGGCQDHVPVVECEINQTPDHYCSTEFCNSSAFVTTCWPGARPEMISCFLSGS